MEQEQTNQPRVETEKMFAAIDVGTTKIVALVGYRNESGTMEILGKGEAVSAGLHAGIIQQVHIAKEAISRAVEDARKEAGFFPKKVVVGVAGRHFMTEDINIPLNRVHPEEGITENELIELRENAKKQIPLTNKQEVIYVIPKKYEIDNEVIANPLGYPCHSIKAQFLVGKGDTESLGHLRRCIADLGMMVTDDMFYLEPLASADAILTEEEKVNGIALVDMGGGTCDMAIYADGIIQKTHIIPLGGQVITNDIVGECKISEQDAEKIKIKYGSATAIESNQVMEFTNDPGKRLKVSRLSCIISSRVDQILNEILFQINTSGLEERIRSIVLTGGCSNLKNLTQICTYKFTKTVRTAFPEDKVVYKKEKYFNNAKYSTVIGLLQKSESIWNEDYEKLLAERKAQTLVDGSQNNGNDEGTQTGVQGGKTENGTVVVDVTTVIGGEDGSKPTNEKTNTGVGEKKKSRFWDLGKLKTWGKGVINELVSVAPDRE